MPQSRVPCVAFPLLGRNETRQGWDTPLSSAREPPGSPAGAPIPAVVAGADGFLFRRLADLRRAAVRSARGRRWSRRAGPRPCVIHTYTRGIRRGRGSVGRPASSPARDARLRRDPHGGAGRGRRRLARGCDGDLDVRRHLCAVRRRTGVLRAGVDGPRPRDHQRRAASAGQRAVEGLRGHRKRCRTCRRRHPRGRVRARSGLRGRCSDVCRQRPLPGSVCG